MERRGQAIRFHPTLLDSVAHYRFEPRPLARLRSPSGQAYFVPLGLLEPGSYRLRIEGQGVDAGGSMEIINGEFDYFDKEIVNRGYGTIELKFQADARSEYYLRITSRDPLNFRSIAFVGQ